MGLFTKDKTRAPSGRQSSRASNVVDGADSINLYLYLSDTEWRVQFVSPDGTATNDTMGEAVIIAKNRGKAFADIGEIIQRALKQINDRQIRKIGTVSVVLSDPGITLLDNLDSHFSSANVAKIRQYGAESLHCEEVSYGFSRFGPADRTTATPARADQGVFGFADVTVLRRYLGQLERLAVKTVMISPVAQNTIFDAQRHPDRTMCGIYMGGRSTQVVVCNAARGSVTTRKLPLGLYTLVDTVAAANNVSIKEALTALSRRDCLSQVLHRPGNPRNAENQVPGQFERILGDKVRALGDEIELTLRFFDVQRMGGRPDAIKLYGPVASIKGLTAWFGKRLGVDVTDANAGVLSDLIHRPRTEGLNLLEGARSPLITIGRVNYAWDKDRFLPEHEMDSDDSAEEKAAAAVISGRTGTKGDAPPPRPRRSHLFGRVRTREEPRAAKRSQRRQPLPPENRKNNRAGYVLLALFAFVSLFGGYKTFIAPKISQFNQLSHTYIAALNENASLRTQSIREMAAGPRLKHSVSTGQNKVLWTEKFLALGCYSSKAVWLTDVFLTTATTSAAGKPENIQKLTIKGAILPSTDGHLLKISEYIRRLEEDKRGLFMGDFKRITFEGAAIDYEDVEEIIRFTIEGWYDKSKPRPAKKPVGQGDLSMAACLTPDKPDASGRKEALLGPGGLGILGTDKSFLIDSAVLDD